MAIHLNYDGKQNNGIIFNDTYTNGALYRGSHLKPSLSFEFDSFQYSEVFVDALDHVQLGNTKTVMTQAQADEIKLVANSWVQELGQEGNPSPEQIQEVGNNEARQYLSSTDWYVIRFQETGETVPAEITTLRAEARLAIL